MRDNRKSFMRFWQIFSPLHRPRFLIWKLFGSSATFDGTLRSGLRIRLRPSPAADYGVAYEVLHQRIYDPPFPIPQTSVHHIVDLGANIGFSCLFWLQEYPQSRVTAFEPHPVHTGIVRDHLALNGFESRVNLVDAAASTAPGEGYLTDARSSSRLASADSRKAVVPVRIVDLFSTVSGPIDILKIDIEGAEYPILADPRFDALAGSARFIILEWHRTAEQPEGGAWCTKRLQDLGFEVTETARQSNSGLLWARRP